MSDNMTDEVVVGLSKKKVFLLIVGSFAFVALGVWMFSLDASSIARNLPRKDPRFVHGVGVAAIAFFGLCGSIGLRKMFDKKPGLVLNSSGITDNSSGVSAGFIPWSEIKGAKILQVGAQKILIIMVEKPEAYVGRGNILQRAANKMNFNLYGTPILIASNTLKIGFPELHSLFHQYLQAFGNAGSISSTLVDSEH